MSDYLLRRQGFSVDIVRSKVSSDPIQLAKRGDTMKFFEWDNGQIGCEVKFRTSGTYIGTRKKSEWETLGLVKMAPEQSNTDFGEWYQGKIMHDNDLDHLICVTVYLYKDQDKGVRVYVKPIPHGDVQVLDHENEDGYWDAEPN